ncbi:MAG: Sensor histidine kinase YehU [Bacteroidetes bacterium ADurb.Bin408]|nr:MAG: Sensor histidine kinase YehU [Bacteroidetes bacterium ADurb.Bin408]
MGNLVKFLGILLIIFLVTACKKNVPEQADNDEVHSDIQTFEGKNTDSLLSFTHKALDHLKSNPSNTQHAAVILDCLRKLNMYRLYDDVVIIASEAIKLVKNKDLYILVQIKDQLAFSWFSTYDFAPAKALLLDNMLINAQSIKDKAIEHEINLYLGTLYYKDEIYDSALYYFSLTDNDKAYDNKSIRTMILNNIGGIYDYLEEYATAIRYFKRALLMAQETGDSFFITMCLNNIGSSYLALDSFDLAVIYLDLAIASGKKYDHLQLLASSLSNRGLIYENDSLPEKALECYKQAFYYDSVYNNYYGMMVSHNNIAKIYFALDDIKNAYAHAFQSLSCYETAGNMDALKDAYQILSLCSKAQDKPDDAYNYLRLYALYYDSLYNENRTYQLKKTEAIYKLKKMEGDLDVLKTEKNTIQDLLAAKQKESRYLWIFAGLFLLILVFLLITFVNIRKRHRLEQLYTQNMTEKAIIELNHRLFTSQINSHFISNILNGIQSLYVNGQTEEASQYLSRFNRLLRTLLEASFVKVESLRKSLDFLELYLSLEKMRFGQRLNYEIFMEEGLDPSDVFLPPLIFQPFVENAIKHGFRRAGKENIIHLSFGAEGKSLHVEIVDNGLGYNFTRQQHINNRTHGSRGLKLSQERIELWGKELKQPTAFSIDDYKGGLFDRGTLVKISIPFINDDYDYED